MAGFWQMLKGLYNVLVGHQNKVQVLLPDGAVAKTVTDGGGAWTMGAYMEIIDPTTEDYVLTGVDVYTVTNAVAHQIDIAIGAAGSEAVIASVPFMIGTASDSKVMPVDHLEIRKGVRLAARQSNSAGGGTTVLVKLVLQKDYKG